MLLCGSAVWVSCAAGTSFAAQRDTTIFLKLIVVSYLHVWQMHLQRNLRTW